MAVPIEPPPTVVPLTDDVENDRIWKNWFSNLHAFGQSSYVLIDGTRAMTGDLDVGGNSNIGIDGLINSLQLINVANSGGVVDSQAVSLGGVMSGKISKGGSGAATLRMTNAATACFGSPTASVTGTAVVEAIAAAAFVSGSVTATAGTGTVTSGDVGSFAQGRVKNTGSGVGVVEATYAGASVFGYVSCNSTAGKISSVGYGSFAHGYVRTQSGTCLITVSGSGAFGGGYVRAQSSKTANITASGDGSFVNGFARGKSANAEITSSGSGSFAVGFAYNQVIIASATNSAQFGVGTNAVADSLQVGSGVNLRAAGNIFMAETTEITNIAGFGQLWCTDNAGTTELWFSDDTGTDTQLA